MPMKRPGWWVAAGAVAGFAGVFGLHGGKAATPGLAGGPAPGGAGPAPAGSAPPAPSASGTARPAGGGGTAPAAGPVRQAAGALVPYGYGELSVTVTVRGNQITNVTVPVLRTADPMSERISQQAIPVLRSEVLAAHGAGIHGVSGATYTSEAYARSIQSALDKLHLK